MTKNNPINTGAQRQGEGRVRDPYQNYTGPEPSLPAKRVPFTPPYNSTTGGPRPVRNGRDLIEGSNQPQGGLDPSA